VPPEQLLSALLLQVFYGIRSERQLMEQLEYNLLYRWFVGLSPDDPVWDPTTFTKNRDRLQEGDAFQKLLNEPNNYADILTNIAAHCDQRPIQRCFGCNISGPRIRHVDGNVELPQRRPRLLCADCPPADRPYFS
jgi:hypothetical protein